MGKATRKAAKVERKLPGPARAGQSKDMRITPAGKFGQRLEELMEAAGLTTTELAEKSGLTPDMIRKCIRGIRTPDIDRWPAVAKALGLRHIRELVPDISVGQ